MSHDLSLDQYTPSKAWWKSATLYQIYPLSFQDSNGDGLGDLNGIRSRLGYIKDLGADVVWLSPVYKSPLADMGYDISDYFDIDPRYGTLADWDNLLKATHDCGMKLIMDLVINHTSDEHEWFKESRSSKLNPKRDWYIWRPPKYDQNGNRAPPNNWKSCFQGSAWEWDEKTREYYLHLYVSKQPDLNWDNPEVRKAAWGVMKFWIDRGCDGFRMDVINLLSKADGLPDAPIEFPGDPYQPASTLFANGPRIHEYIQEMYREVLSKHDLITVGETPFTHNAAVLSAYVLPENKELQMVFQFEIMDLDSPKIGRTGDVEALIYKPWSLQEMKETITRWQTYRRDEGFWNTIFIENHDHARAVSRFGSDKERWRALSAKMLALLEIGQGGTLFLFQGQELGLANFPRTWSIDEYKDKIYPEEGKADGGEVDMSDIMDNFQKKARDHARVPMQWDTTSYAGFSTSAPWMRVNEDYKQWNAEIQKEDKNSVYTFYKRALNIRKSYDVLIYGQFRDVSINHPNAFAFIRKMGTSQALVILNFRDFETDISLSPEVESVTWDLMLGNYESTERFLEISDRRPIRLREYEGRLYVSQ